MSLSISATQIKNFFKDWQLHPASHDYISIHSQRYAYLVEKIHQLSNQHAITSILDIGGSFQTELIREHFKNITVNTLGFSESLISRPAKTSHFNFDLNQVQNPDCWASLEKHDLIVFAEVIEHLYTSPKLVLKFLSKQLKKDGFMLLQTPNACSLGKRLKMLLGKNPYDLIKEDNKDPAHFREYTPYEISAYLIESGYEIISLDIKNYFRCNSPLKLAIKNIMPSSLKDGMTIVARKK